MKFMLSEKIKEFENLIFKGYKLWIFKGYVAIDKRGVEKIINDIYATLSTDVENAKEYLKTNNITTEVHQQKNDIYKVLKDINSVVNKATRIFPFILIKEAELEKLEKELKSSIPDEISQAENLD